MVMSIWLRLLATGAILYGTSSCSNDAAQLPLPSDAGAEGQVHLDRGASDMTSCGALNRACFLGAAYAECGGSGDGSPQLFWPPQANLWAWCGSGRRPSA